MPNLHRGEIEARVLDLDSVRGEFVSYDAKAMGRFEQCLAGNAPHPQASPSQARLFFDAGDVHAELVFQVTEFCDLSLAEVHHVLDPLPDVHKTQAVVLQA